MEITDRFHTCRWCKHNRNGRCMASVMTTETDAETTIRHSIEDGEISSMLAGTMPHHINNLIDQLVPELPTKWKKAISQALLDSSESDYWEMSDSIEDKMIQMAKEIDDTGYDLYVENQTEFVCSRFE